MTPTEMEDPMGGMYTGQGRNCKVNLYVVVKAKVTNAILNLTGSAPGFPSFFLRNELAFHLLHVPRHESAAIVSVECAHRQSSRILLP